MFKLGWFAIGFGEGMHDSDMIVIEVDNNELIVKDSYSNNHSSPS